MHEFHESLDRAHIQLLLALRDAGQLGRAADVLSISPSAASHRLKEAERRLGAPLVEPDGRSIKLTPSGVHLANVGAMSEASLRSAENAARWLSSAGTSAVRLAVAFYDSAPWYRHFGADTSLGFRVDVVRVRYGDEAAAVERRVADLAIQLRPAAGVAAQRAGLSVVTSTSADSPDLLVSDDKLVAVTSIDHPAATAGALRPEHVRDACYLTAGRGPTTGFEHTEFMAPNEAYPNQVVQIESVNLIYDLVAVGRGITVQPMLAAPARPIDRGLAVVPLATASGSATVPVRWQAVVSPHPDRADNALVLLGALQERYTSTPSNN